MKNVLKKLKVLFTCIAWVYNWRNILVIYDPKLWRHGKKKTDITTAINIATKKRLPHVVKELQSKLESLSPHVSHTTVKHAKEKHLASKNLKNELQSLADRRFQRLKETATERVIAIMAMWAQHEENNARRELEALGETIREIERAVTEEHIEADGGAHLFAAKASGSAAASLATASRR
mmetsp:Transcript_13354/g.19451  ORF Transcript_13354/g.19451 Transcript_13354/m.19451 type:complete len:179 (-) Transcript_13354:908-1444(-)